MRLIAATLLVLICFTPLEAQTKPPYASCAWWQSLKADASNELFLIGYAQGLVLGAAAYPLPDTPIDENRAVFKLYQAGEELLLQKPALVEDYIHAKCADPKNATVRLHGLGLLAAFEKGGVRADRIEAALQLYRNDTAPKRQTVLDALSGK